MNDGTKFQIIFYLWTVKFSFHIILTHQTIMTLFLFFSLHLHIKIILNHVAAKQNKTKKVTKKLTVGYIVHWAYFDEVECKVIQMILFKDEIGGVLQGKNQSPTF